MNKKTNIDEKPTISSEIEKQIKRLNTLIEKSDSPILQLKAEKILAGILKLELSHLPDRAKESGKKLDFEGFSE